MFICMPKTHFIIHLFLEIFYLGILGIICRENVWQRFSKNWKNTSTMNFSAKKESVSYIYKLSNIYKYSNYLPSYKCSEKTNKPFLRKMLKWETDGQTHRQTTVGLDSVGRGSKNLVFWFFQEVQKETSDMKRVDKNSLQKCSQTQI